MIIAFTNYKKVYVILGVFAFLIVSLYIASEIYSRKWNKADGEVKVSNLSSEDESTTIKFLLDKTKFFLNSSFIDIQKDNVFQGIKSESLNEIYLEIQGLKTSGNIEYAAVTIDADGPSGKTYIKILDKVGKSSEVFEFSYRKNGKNEWELADIKPTNP